MVLSPRTGHETFEAIRANQRGELLLRASAAKQAQAERQFVRCLELARTQGRRRSWELRAATSLARLWAHQGKRHRRDLLAPVYGWFTEGFDTADLNDAKALLDDRGGWLGFFPPTPPPPSLQALINHLLSLSPPPTFFPPLHPNYLLFLFTFPTPSHQNQKPSHGLSP